MTQLSQPLSMVPLGGIINWSGAILDIPENWQLCDGTNGTPDLRDNMVIGAGSTHAVDAVGGSLTHTHPVDLGSHDHSYDDEVDCAASGPAAAVDAADRTRMTDIAGATDADGALPPFYALAFIQRML